MSKPLTIEELKALPVGDYVWAVYPHLSDCHNEYIKKDSKSTDDYLANELDFYSGYLMYSNYGTMWLAYKNKEQAEGKDDEIRKQMAKEILQHFMGLPTCQHPTIGTGQFMFGKNYIRELVKEYGVEVEE